MVVSIETNRRQIGSFWPNELIKSSYIVFCMTNYAKKPELYRDPYVWPVCPLSPGAASRWVTLQAAESDSCTKCSRFSQKDSPNKHRALKLLAHAWTPCLHHNLALACVLPHSWFDGGWGRWFGGRGREVNQWLYWGDGLEGGAGRSINDSTGEAVWREGPGGQSMNLMGRWFGGKWIGGRNTRVCH